MTLILFCKIIYVLSCICAVWPIVVWHKEEGYVSLESIVWSTFLVFLPFVNTMILVLHFVEEVPFEKVFTYKIWEKK